MNEQLVCDWCQESFQRPNRRGPRPKYCGVAHRQQAYRARQMAAFAQNVGRKGSDELAEAAQAVLGRRGVLGADGDRLREQVKAATKVMAGSKVFENMQKTTAAMTAGSKVFEDMQKTTAVITGPSFGDHFLSEFQGSLWTVSHEAFGDRLGADLRAALVKWSKQTVGIDLAERMRQHIGRLISPTSPLDVSSRMAISYLLSEGAGQAFKQWSASTAIDAVEELADAAESSGDDIDDPSIDSTERVALGVPAAVAALLVATAAVGPLEALRSAWAIGYVTISVLGHLDSTSDAFHGLIVLIGLLAIITWRR
jgi:hypothetical protein